MACSPDGYAYGFAGCCRCECAVNLASQPAGWSVRYLNADLYFFFCPRCSAHLCNAGTGVQEQAVSRAIEKAWIALPRRTHLAVTTSIAIRAHGGDLVKACEIGVDMPRPLHDAIVSGDAEATFLAFDWEA